MTSVAARTRGVRLGRGAGTLAERFPNHAIQNVTRALANIGVNAPDVLAHQTERDELRADEEEQDGP